MRKNGFKKDFPAFHSREFFDVCITNIEVIIRFYFFSLESICTCEFFKNLYLHCPKQLVHVSAF